MDSISNKTKVNRQINFDSLVKQFLDWEFDNNLDKIIINEIPIWFFVREQLFTKLLFKISFNQSESFKLYGQRKSEFLKNNVISLSKDIIISLVKSTVHMLKSKNTKIMAITYPWTRKQKFDGMYYDIIYDDMFDFLKEDDVCILELPGYQRKITHYKNNYKKKRITFGDILYFKELFKVVADGNYKIQTLCNLFLEFAQSSFGIDINRDTLFIELQSEINRNLKRVQIFDSLINKFSPKTILITAGYAPTMRLITLLAKKKNIEVVEFQHGHIYPYHFGYHYHKGWSENKENLPIADKVFVFGNYYKAYLMNHGIWNDPNITVMGNPFTNSDSYKKKLTTFSNMNKHFKYTILIISQHTMTETLIYFLKGFEQYKEILFIIKTHPHSLEEEKQYREKLVSSDNLLIVNKGSIFDYLQHSDISLGIYTSGLIDSISVGIPACTINIKGRNLLNDLVEQDYLRRVDSLEEVISLLKSGYNRFNYQTKGIYSKYCPDVVAKELSDEIQQNLLLYAYPSYY